MYILYVCYVLLLFSHSYTHINFYELSWVYFHVLENLYFFNYILDRCICANIN